LKGVVCVWRRTIEVGWFVGFPKCYLYLDWNDLNSLKSMRRLWIKMTVNLGVLIINAVVSLPEVDEELRAKIPFQNVVTMSKLIDD
jgi:hypothetical protein